MATLATPVTEGGQDRAVKGGPSFSEFWFFVISVSGPCVCPTVTALSVFFIRPEYMLPFTVFPLSYTFDASQRYRFDDFGFFSFLFCALWLRLRLRLASQ